jgi:hypothetical protein
LGFVKLERKGGNAIYRYSDGTPSVLIPERIKFEKFEFRSVIRLHAESFALIGGQLQDTFGSYTNPIPSLFVFVGGDSKSSEGSVLAKMTDCDGRAIKKSSRVGD